MIVIFVFLVLISLISAVDKDIFKTCAQSSFCRRCRAQRGPSKYEVLLETLSLANNKITVDIRNNENRHLFVLELGAVKKTYPRDSIFHFEIDEKRPLKPRHRVTEALKGAPTYEEIYVTNSTADVTVYCKTFGSARAVIQLSPFQVDFIRSNSFRDRPLVTVNGKDLMRFEQLRTKPQTLDRNEDPDSLEKGFHDLVDTKPNGSEAVALDFTFPGSEVLFAIPEHADSFSLKPTIDGEPYRLFNLDADSSRALYGAVPVIYSYGSSHTSAGVFWHNSADTFVDIFNKKTVHFMSEAGIIDVFVFMGPTIDDVFTEYASISGVANLPTFTHSSSINSNILHSLGYHQSRWNSFTHDEVTEVNDNVDKNGIEYTDKRKYFTWNKESFDGLDRSYGHLRSFILTRSFFSGSQRYAAFWTVDNTAEGDYLEVSIEMCLSLSVADGSFCRSDVDGFIGEPEDELELFVRWYQAAAFQPFFRSHSEITPNRRKSYSLPEASMSIVREAIRKRYALLTFWYTMFYEHERFGTPVMRPMLSYYDTNSSGFELDDQYMLGDKLLVRPITEKGADRVNVFLPGIYFDFDDFRRFDSSTMLFTVDFEKIPVFQRGGTIIPVKETNQTSMEHMASDPISLFIAVYSSWSEGAAGTVYIDNGKSYYGNEKKYLYLRMSLYQRELTIRKIDEDAHFETDVKIGRILIAGLSEVPEDVTLVTASGNKVQLEIFNVNSNFFEIKTTNLFVTDEWTIVLGGARQHILRSALALVMAMLHVSKFL